MKRYPLSRGLKSIWRYVVDIKYPGLITNILNGNLFYALLEVFFRTQIKISSPKLMIILSSHFIIQFFHTTSKFSLGRLSADCERSVVDSRPCFPNHNYREVINSDSQRKAVADWVLRTGWAETETSRASGRRKSPTLKKQHIWLRGESVRSIHIVWPAQ